MRSREFSLLHVILAAVLGAVAAVFTLALALRLTLGADGFALLEGWTAVRASFVGEYDAAEAADSALTGLVAGLGDRWSYYLGAEDYAEQNERRNNSYVGVGVTVGYDDPRGLTILSVRAGAPAEAAGLTPGEIVTAVDGLDVSGEGQAAGVDAVRGEEGTEVTLTVLGLDGESREVTVKRASVENLSVEYELLPGGVGYVDVNNFYTHSARQLTAAVDDLVSRGAEALVFDLRDNGGGYVDELTEMLDHLLPEGPIFRSQNKRGREVVTWSDADRIDLPMATLVNADTYSAAEFFAAQLQESLGAPIVGVETSGKGYSQQALPLANGGALNLSTGKYTTGAGVSLVGAGVTLDAEVSLTEEESLALWAGTLDHGADPQLQKALELLEK